ncbi:hypothetical protein QYH60_04165 [Lactococcus lactis subsp. lactis]|uniref:hypothetical protein n=1 Tax=Lactococcus lactis TaxID=1358 RepID=UPI002648BFA5|nr:hypothetical protein [Lactococcus lactis]WKB49125.1 hypothetical protein QYH60_03660 [Lactococcus lactis subsp. lactis]WKB49223.1 hypothetical protein QYH60_04165 [Lactococcus lactis subsp. lactis]
MMKQTTCYSCDKPIEPEWLPEGEFIVCDECSSDTDKLSVEKLQEHLLPYKKEMVQKIRDEKMQLVTADEFLKLHKESLTAIRENDKLQEQLNTAKYFFKNILDVNPNLHGGNSVMHLKNCVNVMKNSAEKALAAIGGDDD